ncbi:MAG: 16S rRNA (adenine(1518)-N(6)/adenine(1519)-N(6))-dimethyltransferase RsmA [Parcubacteria group bacterium]
MKPKKSLGQNFLQNDTALQRIADALDIKEGDTVVEIGPGHGELTSFLVAKNPQKLITIEKDENLAGLLRQEFRNVQVIAGDALKILPEIKLPKNWKLIGNIPYYITGQLLRITSELSIPPAKTVFLVQREVAERICATLGKANLLSSVIRGWATPNYLFTVPKNDFYPKPKVDSAVVSLDRNEYMAEKAYSTVVHALFLHPRKKAINNFSDFFNIPKSEAEKIFNSCNLPSSIRPQNLSSGDIFCISKKL